MGCEKFEPYEVCVGGVPDLAAASRIQVSRPRENRTDRIFVCGMRSYDEARRFIDAGPVYAEVAAGGTGNVLIARGCTAGGPRS